MLTCIHASRVRSEYVYGLPKCRPTVLELWSPGYSPVYSGVSLCSLWISAHKFHTDIIIRISTNGEGEIVSVDDTKAKGKTGFMTPPILNIGTIWGCVGGQFWVLSLHRLGKAARFPLNKCQSVLSGSVERKTLRSLSGFEPLFYPICIYWSAGLTAQVSIIKQA